MKFTLSWLKDHLETTASVAQIADTLTRIGLEVERIVDPAARLAGFVVARIISAEQHPNADRLRLCLVDAGSGAPIQVVCGAPNARAGLVSVFAPAGTYIPGKDLVLQTGVIRGVDSHGMLCSAKELEVADDHEGIMELPPDAPIGAAYATYAGFDDPIIEINLTPNRADATGVAGIARDLAAAGLGRAKTPAVPPLAGSFRCATKVSRDFAPSDAHLAPCFVLAQVRGLVNGPSPEWLRRRLSAVGLRPINALVDVTNYLTYDRGRPLHVFDAKKVSGDLIVRRAREGETILALDGRSYALSSEMVVIADARGPNSIAGVMGGESTGCDETTTDVLIECALWDPLNIARTGRDLGISTDARYRFERGVDPAFCIPGAELAVRMILDLCGGEASELTIVGAPPAVDRTIDFPWSEAARTTGLEIPAQDMVQILEALGFEIVSGGPREPRVQLKPPSWRADVEGKADIVEEIVRIIGVDRIPAVPLPRDLSVSKPVLTLLQKRARLARRTLASRGMLEAVTWSFIAKDDAVQFGGGTPALALAHPIAADLSDMRPSLAPGLLKALARNAARGQRDLAAFEVGQIFLGDGESDQRLAACAVRSGSARPTGAGRHWSGSAGPVEAFDAKADALALLESLGVPTGGLVLAAPGPDFLHPGRSAELRLGPRQTIGWIGEFHPSLLEALDAQGPVCGFEIVIDLLPPPKAKPTKARAKLELPELMAVERDFAFVVDRAVPAGDLVKAALSADRTLVVAADVFDVYEGPGVPEGKKSIAVSVTLQPRDKTLTEADLDAASAKIVAEASKRVGAVLRA